MIRGIHGDRQRFIDTYFSRIPGIYFTGTVFLCNQTRGTTTIDTYPYRYT